MAAITFDTIRAGGSGVGARARRWGAGCFPGNVFVRSEGVTGVYGSARPPLEISLMMHLYTDSKTLLDRFITERYPLGQINEAFAAMLKGRVVRADLKHGKTTFDHPRVLWAGHEHHPWARHAAPQQAGTLLHDTKKHASPESSTASERPCRGIGIAIRKVDNLALLAEKWIDQNNNRGLLVWQPGGAARCVQCVRLPRPPDGFRDRCPVLVHRLLEAVVTQAERRFPLQQQADATFLARLRSGHRLSLSNRLGAG